jgi:prefoldin subunit 5
MSLKSIQELQQMIEALQKRVAELEREVKQLKLARAKQKIGAP